MKDPQQREPTLFNTDTKLMSLVKSASADILIIEDYY
jgi:hypothetical protein